MGKGVIDNETPPALRATGGAPSPLTTLGVKLLGKWPLPITLLCHHAHDTEASRRTEDKTKTTGRLRGPAGPWRRRCAVSRTPRRLPDRIERASMLHDQ